MRPKTNILEESANRTRTGWIRLAIVFIFLNAFGFPGNYTRVFGSSFGTLIEYGSFLLQIGIMLATSGDSALDVKVINLDWRFQPIYLYIFVTFVGSMLVTIDKSEQLVSCIRVSVTALFAIWLCMNLSAEELLEEAHYAQILFILASIAFPVAFPEYYIRSSSYSSDFIGLGGVKNQIASETAFGIVMQVALLRIRLAKREGLSFIFIAFLVVQIGVLLAAHSAGAIILTVTASGYLLVVDKWLSRIPIGLTYVMGSILFLIGAMTIIPLFEPILNALGKDATLTGRIPLWHRLFDVMQESHTFLGYGYGMFWKDPRAIALVHTGFERGSFFAQMRSGAHNNTIELLINQGIIGASIFFGSVLAAFYDTSNTDQDKYLFMSGYMLFFMIHGWTERAWTTYEYGLLFLFIAIGMACAGKQKT